MTPAKSGTSGDSQNGGDWGSKGVLLLLCSESTNAGGAGGYTPSEQMVGENLESMFMKAKRKVIVSTFASNVSRIQQVVHASQKDESKN